MADQSSLLRRPGDLDELLSFLADATDHHANRRGSTALETALRCLPEQWLSELVALAECGRQDMGRTVCDVEDLLRLGIGQEPREQLVRKLVAPGTTELIARGLERLADLPRFSAASYHRPNEATRRRRTQPIVLPDSVPDTET